MDIHRRQEGGECPFTFRRGTRAAAGRQMSPASEARTSASSREATPSLSSGLLADPLTVASETWRRLEIARFEHPSAIRCRSIALGQARPMTDGGTQRL